MTSSDVKAKARELGFDLCGIAPAEVLPETRHFRDWLSRGHAGEMHYLERTAARREDPRRVLPSARSIVALGILYNTDRPYSTERSDPGAAAISRYAWGEDYHVVVGARLDALSAWMRQQVGEGFESKAYVDTGPVLERQYAQRAGIGWIGKNTCVINPQLGSWIFLAEILCNAPLDSDPPALDQCGSCTLCLEACPTGAFTAPRVLDATCCISYLTIELKEAIPEPLRPAVGAHAYGCDVCQEVCPWNFTPAPPSSGDRAWLPRAALDSRSLAALWRLTDDDLHALVADSAMSRAGVRGLRRNLAVAIGNSGDAEAAAALEEVEVNDPMVLEHVKWARAQVRSTKAEVNSGPSLRTSNFELRT
ncbi:MAG: tRNA epoxyqueuosine(34) reductase QueG [Vicinamibacterales bacterium]